MSHLMNDEQWKKHVKSVLNNNKQKTNKYTITYTMIENVFGFKPNAKLYNQIQNDWEISCSKARQDMQDYYNGKNKA